MLRDVTLDRLHDFEVLQGKVRHPENADKTAYSELHKPNGKLSDFDKLSAHKDQRPLTPPKELFYDDKYDLQADPSYKKKLSARRQTLEQANREMAT